MNEIGAYALPDFLARYGIGRTKAYEEINAGRLKARKLGHKTISTQADAEAWLAGLPALNPNRAA